MPELTRRRDPDAPQTTWLINYDDVRVGTIAERIGNPDRTPPWQWACGFYPGSHPRECTHGTAATFDDARAAFESAWRIFFANRTEADFQQWRDDRAFDAWKHAMWDAHCMLPTQVADGRSRCFCGAAMGIAEVATHIVEAHGRRMGWQR